MKSDRRWLGWGAWAAAAATVLFGVLIAIILRVQFLQSMKEAQIAGARKSISNSIEEFRQIIEQEARRPFTEYSHSNFPGVSFESFLRFSNISALEPSVRIPGLVGFFQVTDKKKLELPFLPESFVADRQDVEKRRALARKVYSALFKTQPINADVEIRERYRRLFSGIRLANFNTTDIVTPKPIPTKGLSLKLLSSKVEQTKVKRGNIEDLLPISQSMSSNSRSFPIQAFILESGFIVFFRSVVHEGRILTQGFIVDQKKFFEALFGELLSSPKSQTANPTHLTLLVEDRALGIFPSPGPEDSPLFQFEELSPFEGFSLLVSSGDVRLTPPQVVAILAVLFIAFMILAAIVLMYRTTIRQIELSERQTAFISSVSHELRTPLTAIRMHGELLKSGWLNEDSKKMSSYDYILKESERLSRLIENVLRYARIGRDSDPLNLQILDLDQIKKILEEKIKILVTSGDFEFSYLEQLPSHFSAQFEVDPDALTQILINVTENGMKFSRSSRTKKIVLTLREAQGSLEILIRDFGPGISESDRKKVFELFYRGEDEMTRTTTGTGLGLALVKSLADRMKIQVNFHNHQPGCEFSIRLPELQSN